MHTWFLSIRPVKVFMDDTGSLALGASLVSITIITKHELIFIIVMGVFIFEILICIIQIINTLYFHNNVYLNYIIKRRFSSFLGNFKK